MARHAQVNFIEHPKLRVRTERSALLGDSMMACPVFPHEFRELQASYPVVFTKEDKSGLFRPMALFGLERNENVFLDGDHWDATYLPLALRIQPFLIGLRGVEGEEPTPEVHINLEHPRVSETEGEALFTETGEHTEFLKSIAELLAEVHGAEGNVVAFSAMLNELDLLEPFSLDVTLENGTVGKLTGFYTIKEERLYALNGEELERLQKAQMLQAIFMSVASISQFLGVISRKNKRLLASI
ncbi:MAG: SapC family protein [Parvularculaceae bacterium]|nr:SapC family protein [Parvularculaceae bacterium]